MIRSMHTMMWWSIWGLVVGIGFFGLQEAHHNSIHFILAIPILSGAAAAAAIRLRHEYHEAMLHAKWVVVSTGLLLVGTGYLYVRTEGYGPFASGTATKAFLGATFGMSEPEVERALNRKMMVAGPETAAPEGLRDWMLEMVPDFERKAEARVLQDLVLYHMPCQARFDFVAGKLARVAIEFQPTTSAETVTLLQNVTNDIARDYKPAPMEANKPLLYQKDSVDAVIDRTSIDSVHQQITVVLQYLPLAEKQAGPLTAESNAF